MECKTSLEYLFLYTYICTAICNGQGLDYVYMFSCNKGFATIEEESSELSFKQNDNFLKMCDSSSCHLDPRAGGSS